MDKYGPLVWLLVFLTDCINSVSGNPRAPEPLRVSAWDGEVAVIWDPPTDVTSETRYSVQMSRFNEAWQNVSSCTLIQATLCDLNSDINDYEAMYRVRVQTVTANGASRWSAIKKVLLNDCRLRPPSFTLRTTSSSLMLTVDEKPLLKKIFLFGMRYTIYLEDRSKHNESTTVYLDDNQGLAEGRTHTFRALSWGREYCFRLQAIGIGGLVPSALSPAQCAVLPEPEWYKFAVPAVVALGVLTALAALMSILCSFVRRPGKTPVALKSPPTGWSPLVVREASVELVTDRGWLLCVGPKAPPGGGGWGTKDERRISMDSGVSVGSGGTAKAEGGDTAGQEQDDSGCASGSEGSQSFAEERPPQAGTTRAEAKPEDGGLCGRGVREQLSGGQDSGFHAGPTRPASEQYRHQGSPVAVAADEAVEEVRADPDWSPAGVFTGYRRGRLSTPFGDAGEQPAFTTNYRRKTHVQMETVVSVEDAGSPLGRKAFEDAAPLLFLPLPFLPEPGDGVSISLSDVELWGE